MGTNVRWDIKSHILFARLERVRALTVVVLNSYISKNIAINHKRRAATVAVKLKNLASQLQCRWLWVVGGSGGGSGFGFAYCSSESSDDRFVVFFYLIFYFFFILQWGVLFYYSRYIILLLCLYYFIVLKAKIDPLLQQVVYSA